MSEWKTYKLGDLVEVQNGYAFKANDFSDKGIPVIKIRNIVSPRILFDDCEFYEGNLDKRLEQFIIRKGDILISMTGSHVNQIASAVGKVGKYQFDYPALLNQRVGKIFSKNEKLLNQDYFYYHISRFETQVDLASSAGGSANQANISPSQIKNLEINVPDLSTQTAIARILTSLDDKIELNLQMNQTLEAMAQAIFKEWCWVEEVVVPDSWEWKKLLDIADVSSSKRIFRDEYILNGIPFYRGKEVTQLSNGNTISTELFISEERYIEINEKFGVPKIGDILITSVGTIGSVWLVDNDLPFYFKDGNVTWIKDYKTEINGEFVYQWLQTKEAKEQIKSVTIGSTQQALTISALRGLDILIPDNATVSKVCSQLRKINARRIINLNQIQTLTATRDTLLPKLMSGKISLNTI